MRYKMEHRIILNVQVNGASGEPVSHLQEKDFTLLLDHQPHPLVSVRKANRDATVTQAHVIILLDAINSSSRDLTEYRRGIGRFLGQSPSHLPYPISIAVLTNSGAAMSENSTNRDALLGDFKSLTHSLHAYSCASEVNPNDPFMAVWMPGQVSTNSSVHMLSCMNERFKRSVVALDRIAAQQVNIPGRAILIWIGSGWPLLYEKQFRPDDEAVKQDFFANLVRVSNALREGQVTLDMVSPSSLLRKTAELNTHDQAFINGVPGETDVTSGSLSLEALAHQSGGQLLTSSKDLETGIAQCAADATSYYVLTFDVAPAAKPDEFHALTITVNKPSVTVRTSTMFYAEQ